MRRMARMLDRVIELACEFEGDDHDELLDIVTDAADVTWNEVQSVANTLRNAANIQGLRSRKAKR